MTFRSVACLVAFLALLAPRVVAAQDGEKRIALVIGNAAYQAGALATPANDAGLVAQTLEAAGFDVVGSRDLDQDTLRRAFRDFLDKAQASGPNTVAFVYLSGYGLQLEGENYFVPIDARIARDVDVPAEALRLSDYARPLAALNLKAGIIVLDAARASPFAQSGAPLAGGLALVEPEPGMLVAFNAAPGTVAPERQGSYGPYAQALAEMMREGGMPLGDVFDQVRLRVNDITGGAQVPWHASKVQAPFVFFERAPDAPPPAVTIEQREVARARPIRDLGAEEAYMAALDRDTLAGYQDFLDAYPDAPMARRIRAIVAARREAITWRHTRLFDSPAAYWSYLRRYPEGPHAPDARRRLAFLAAALEPPPSFPVLEYDVPPPPPEENVYVDRPVLAFDDPVFAFAPPPPPPVFFLAPPPPEFAVLPPPEPPVALFVLPVLEYRPVPIWVRPPAYIARPPANNVIYENVHNKVIINNTTNTLTITNPKGQTSTVSPPVAGTPPAAPAAGTPPGAPAGAPPAGRAPPTLIGPALPPSVARKALAIQGPAQSAPPPQSGTPGQVRIPPGPPPQQLHQLPSPQGQPSSPHPDQPQPLQAGRPPTPQPGQPPLQPGSVPGQQVQPAGQQQRLKQQLELERQKQADQERQKQGEQQRQKQLELDRQKQIEQDRQKQGEQQRQKQLELDRRKQIEQERQKQGEQQRLQQHQQQIEQQRQQQIQQQRQQQIEQQRQQQIQQQRQQQIDQQRQQQIQQQRQQQIEQQHQQQIQQQRQQQLEQQRQQQILQQQRQQQIQQQQIQQQRQQQQKPPPPCGTPGHPPCPR